MKERAWGGEERKDVRLHARVTAVAPGCRKILLLYSLFPVFNNAPSWRPHIENSLCVFLKSFFSLISKACELTSLTIIFFKKIACLFVLIEVPLFAKDLAQRIMGYNHLSMRNAMRKWANEQWANDLWPPKNDNSICPTFWLMFRGNCPFFVIYILCGKLSV